MIPKHTFRRAYTIPRAGILVAVLTLGATACGSRDDTVDTDKPPIPMATVEITKGDLIGEEDFDGTVTFGEQWAVTTSATGTVTFAQPANAIINYGDVLVGIDNQSIVLAKGSVPMYREMYNSARITTSAPAAVDPNLAEGNEPGEVIPTTTTTTVKPAPIEGNDVMQLQEFLIESGFDVGGRLVADGNFGAQTEEAVKAWQKEQGLPQTGRVDSAQLLFSPRPVRIETELRVGSVYEGLQVTPATPAIRIETSASDRGLFEIDDEVDIQPTDGSTVAGTVTKQEAVKTEDGQTVWQTTITPNEALPEGTTDVEIVVSDIAATDALLVPVSALLALSEGGWAVEVPDGDNTKLVAVELEDVLESTAAISGDLAPGDVVLVPES